MNEDIKKGKLSMVIPFLIGGLVGAGAALLLAPKSGKDLRKDMNELANSARDKVAETVVKGRELYDEGVTTVKDIYGDGITAVKEGIEAGKTAYVKEQAKHRLAA